MAVAENDVFLLTALGRYSGQRIMLTHTLVITAAPGAPDEVATANSIIDGYRGGAGGFDLLESVYRACMPPNYTLEQWTCQRIFGVRTVKQSFVRNVAGTNADIALTGNMAAAITLRTNLAGRTQVSTKHIGPVPDSVNNLDGGFLKAAYKTPLSALKDGLLIGLTDAVLNFVAQPCVFHKGPVPGASLLTSGIAQDTVRVMRRRTVGVGE